MVSYAVPMKLPVATLLLASGCASSSQCLCGRSPHELFPFDGQRSWTFQQQRPDNGTLFATMAHDETLPIPQYRVEYRIECPPDQAGCTDKNRSVVWSSTAETGVQIHSYADVTGFTAFEPALQVIAPDAGVGDVTHSDSNGLAWTCTFQSVEPCPVLLDVSWNDCAHLVIDDGDQDPSTNAGITGHYWALAGMNLVAMRVDQDDGAFWQLTAISCDPTEDRPCDGEW